MIECLVSEQISSSESEPVLAGYVKQNNCVLYRRRQMSSRGRAVWETGVERHKFGKVVSVLEKQTEKKLYLFFLLIEAFAFLLVGDIEH